MPATSPETMIDLLDLSLDELETELTVLGERAFRAKQVYAWVYQKAASDFEAMSDLPKALRERLSSGFSFKALEAAGVAKDKEAEKAAFRLGDGSVVESVRIQAKEGDTYCLSTQVGCDLSCRFCASGQMAFQRNLTAGEIVGQVLTLQRQSGQRPAHLVYMGMGEPFLNYTATMKSLSILQDAQGYGFGARRITVSTAGVVPEIYRFAREAGQVNLAVSLHGTTDTKRQEIMPIARVYDLRQLLDAAWDYTQTTGRRITFEYILIRGVNDSHHDAIRLVEMLKGKLAHLNVISFNPIPGTRYARPKRGEFERFVGFLKDNGLPVTPRHSAGRSIAAACGQLAGKLKEERSR